MSTHEPFPETSADDLGPLLRSFFRAEMPEPWPALSPPVARPEPPRRWNGRAALAASVGLLFLGQLALSSAWPKGGPVGPGRVPVDIAARPGVRGQGFRPAEDKATSRPPAPARVAPR